MPAKLGYDEQDGALQLIQYHDHLVHLEPHQDPMLCDWTVTAYIEFTENLTIHTVVLKLQEVFRSEEEANKFTLRKVEQWIDDRLLPTTSLDEAVAVHVRTAVI